MQNNNGFLPADYKAPEGGYYKFQDGDNTFRVLSSAVTGYEYWTKEDKVVRSATPFTGVPADIKLNDKGEPTKVKHFWAFIVLNDRNGQVQIMQITQKSVQTAIRSLVENPKWGDPKGYDITINRTGSNLTTEYAVMPNPHSKIEAPDISHINLDALFTNEDPFSTTENSVAQLKKEFNLKEKK